MRNSRLIHRDGATNVGKEMTAMLQSLRHRGPDSTGFAIYGPSAKAEYVMRLKLAEQEDLAKDHRIRDKIKARKAEVDQRLKDLGADTIETSQPTDYAFRYRLRFAGDTRQLATEIERIEGAEVLSFGSALELIKDLGDATQVSNQYDLGKFRGHARHRPHPHGDGIGRRYPLRAPLLGLPLQRHRRRP